MAEKLSKEAADYLKENKVYEKLHDALVYVLEQECPDNYLELMRDFFKSGRIPKVIILGCPGSGVSSHAKTLASEIGATLIDDDKQDQILEKIRATKTGWVLEGYPKDFAQACALRRAGIFPNLVIRLNIDVDESVRKQVAKGVPEQKARENIQSYMRVSERTVQVYSAVLHNVDSSGPEEEVNKEISQLVKKIGTWVHPTTGEHYPLGMIYGEDEK